MDCPCRCYKQLKKHLKRLPERGTLEGMNPIAEADAQALSETEAAFVRTLNADVQVTDRTGRHSTSGSRFDERDLVIASLICVLSPLRTPLAAARWCWFMVLHCSSCGMVASACQPMRDVCPCAAVQRDVPGARRGQRHPTAHAGG